MSKENSNLKLINVENSESLVIILRFRAPYNYKDRIKQDLLRRLLLFHNKKYPSLQAYLKKKDELYINDFIIDFKNMINFSVIDMVFCVPRLDLIDDFSLDKALAFLKDIIFKPSIKNEEFLLDAFNMEKEFVYKRDEKAIKDIHFFINDYIDKALKKDGYEFLPHDDYIEESKKVTSKDIYSYYQKMVENSYSAFIYGNLNDKDLIIKTFNKYFNPQNTYHNKIKTFSDFNKIKQFSKTVKCHYQESALVNIININDIKENDLMCFETLFRFLSSRENDLIQYNLRTKNELIYYSRVQYYSKSNLLLITAFLNKKDIDKAQDIIIDTFKDIKTNFELYKERLLKALEYDILFAKDNIYDEVKDILCRDSKFKLPLEEQYDLIKKIAKKQMSSFIDRVVIAKKIAFIGDNDD